MSYTVPGGFTARELQEKAGRFRVVIIGRANSGKTTILKKICNTTEDPIVYDSNGEKIMDSTLKPSIERGNHDIENEMVFRKRPQFIFHDSRGFEAGGVDELKKVKAFIAKRSGAKQLQDQIHVIWYCIPMDNDRPIAFAETKFFSEPGMGKVPVVLIFTKSEALENTAISQLLNERKSWDEARRAARERAENIFNEIRQKVQDMKYPPNAYIRLQELNEPWTTCDALVRHTASVLTSENLQALFVSTQHNSLELAIEFSIRQVTKKAFHRDPKRWPGELIAIVFSFFPYHDYRQRIVTGGDPFNMRFTTWFSKYEDWNVSSDNRLLDLELRSNIASLATFFEQECTSTNPTLRYVQLGVALTILAENLTITWAHAKRVSPGQLAPALEAFRRSPKCGALRQDIDRAFQQYMAQIPSNSIADITIHILMKNPARDALAANLFQIALSHRLEGIGSYT